MPDLVAVKDDAGDIRELPPETAASFLKAGKVTMPTPEELRAHVNSGFGSALAATAEGGARGLSLGLSDPAAIAAARLYGGDKTAEMVRAHLAEQKAAHPYLSTAGEIAGAAAPMLLSGGAGAAGEAGTLARGARALGALPRATAALGEVAGAGAERLVGSEAGSFLGRAGQAIAKHAATGAAENAAFEVGHEVSENSLNGGNHDLTAEQLIAAATHGALFGAGLGGAMGLAGEALATGAGKVADALAERAGATAEGGGLRGFLEKQADKQSWKSLSPGKKFTEEAELRAGGAEAVGNTLRKYGIHDAENVAEAARAPKDLLPRVTEAKEALGEKLGGLIDESTATAKASEIFQPLNEIIEREGQKAGFEATVGSLTQYRDALADKLGLVGPDGKLVMGALDREMPVSQIFKQRKALDDLVYKESKSLDPNLRVGLLREFRGHMADLEIRSIASAEQGMDATSAKYA
jgi:hypothetical protein